MTRCYGRACDASPFVWLVGAAATVVLFALGGSLILRKAAPPAPPWVEWRQLNPNGAPTVWRLYDRHTGVTCYVAAAAGIACFAYAELGAR